MIREYTFESDAMAAILGSETIIELKVILDIQCRDTDGDYEWNCESITFPDGTCLPLTLTEGFATELEKFCEKCAYEDQGDAYQDWVENSYFDDDAYYEDQEES